MHQLPVIKNLEYKQFSKRRNALYALTLLKPFYKSVNKAAKELIDYVEANIDKEQIIDDHDRIEQLQMLLFDREETLTGIYNERYHAIGHLVDIMSTNSDVICMSYRAFDGYFRNQQQLMLAELDNIVRDIYYSSIFIGKPTKTVRDVAAHIYHTNSFNEVSVLADALEDDMPKCIKAIEHLRNGERHYKGCGVVDNILGLR